MTIYEYSGPEDMGKLGETCIGEAEEGAMAHLPVRSLFVGWLVRELRPRVFDHEEANRSSRKASHSACSRLWTGFLSGWVASLGNKSASAASTGVQLEPPDYFSSSEKSSFREKEQTMLCAKSTQNSKGCVAPRISDAEQHTSDDLIYAPRIGALGYHARSIQEVGKSLSVQKVLSGQYFYSFSTSLLFRRALNGWQGSATMTDDIWRKLIGAMAVAANGASWKFGDIYPPTTRAPTTLGPTLAPTTKQPTTKAPTCPGPSDEEFLANLHTVRIALNGVQGSWTLTDDLADKAEKKRAPRAKPSKEEKKANRKSRSVTLKEQAAFLKKLPVVKENKGRLNGKKVIVGRGDYGVDIGRELGGMAGGWLSKLFKKITGMGAYDVATNNNNPGKNSMMADPDGRNLLAFRGDMSSSTLAKTGSLSASPMTTGFHLTSYAVDLTNKQLFPWVCDWVQLFQTVQILGLVFCWEPMVVSTAVGSTVQSFGNYAFSFRYNTNASPPTSIEEMVNSQFGVSNMPSKPACFFVECAPDMTTIPVLRVRRPGDPIGEAQLSQIGWLDFATQGAPNDYLNAGRIHFSGHFVAHKYAMRPPGGDIASYLTTLKPTVDQAYNFLEPVDATPAVPSPLFDSIGIKLEKNGLAGYSIRFDPFMPIGSVYMGIMWRQSTALPNFDFASTTLANGLDKYFLWGYTGDENDVISSPNEPGSAPNGGVTSRIYIWSVIYRGGGTLSAPPMINWGGGGPFTTVDADGSMFITAINPSLVPYNLAPAPAIAKMLTDKRRERHERYYSVKVVGGMAQAMPNVLFGSCSGVVLDTAEDSFSDLFNEGADVRLVKLMNMRHEGLEPHPVSRCPLRVRCPFSLQDLDAVKRAEILEPVERKVSDSAEWDEVRALKRNAEMHASNGNTHYWDERRVRIRQVEADEWQCDSDYQAVRQKLRNRFMHSLNGNTDSKGNYFDVDVGEDAELLDVVSRFEVLMERMEVQMEYLTKVANARLIPVDHDIVHAQQRFVYHISEAINKLPVKGGKSGCPFCHCKGKVKGENEVCFMHAQDPEYHSSKLKVPKCTCTKCEGLRIKLWRARQCQMCKGVHYLQDCPLTVATVHVAGVAQDGRLMGANGSKTGTDDHVCEYGDCRNEALPGDSRCHLHRGMPSDFGFFHHEHEAWLTANPAKDTRLMTQRFLRDQKDRSDQRPKGPKVKIIRRNGKRFFVEYTPSRRVSVLKVLPTAIAFSSLVIKPYLLANEFLTLPYFKIGESSARVSMHVQADINGCNGSWTHTDDLAHKVKKPSFSFCEQGMLCRAPVDHWHRQKKKNTGALRRVQENAQKNNPKLRVHVFFLCQTMLDRCPDIEHYHKIHAHQFGMEYEEGQELQVAAVDHVPVAAPVVDFDNEIKAGPEEREHVRNLWADYRPNLAPFMPVAALHVAPDVAVQEVVAQQQAHVAPIDVQPVDVIHQVEVVQRVHVAREYEVHQMPVLEEFVPVVMHPDQFSPVFSLATLLLLKVLCCNLLGSVERRFRTIGNWLRVKCRRSPPVVVILAPDRASVYLYMHVSSSETSCCKRFFLMPLEFVKGFFRILCCRRGHDEKLLYENCFVNPRFLAERFKAMGRRAGEDKFNGNLTPKEAAHCLQVVISTTYYDFLDSALAALYTRRLCDDKGNVDKSFVFAVAHAGSRFPGMDALRTESVKVAIDTECFYIQQLVMQNAYKASLVPQKSDTTFRLWDASAIRQASQLASTCSSYLPASAAWLIPIVLMGSLLWFTVQANDACTTTLPIGSEVYPIRYLYYLHGRARLGELGMCLSMAMWFTTRDMKSLIAYIAPFLAPLLNMWGLSMLRPIFHVISLFVDFSDDVCQLSQDDMRHCLTISVASLGIMPPYYTDYCQSMHNHTILMPCKIPLLRLLNTQEIPIQNVNCEYNLEKKCETMDILRGRILGYAMVASPGK